jgi:hypothetical protein
MHACTLHINNVIVILNECHSSNKSTLHLTSKYMCVYVFIIHL